MMHLRKGRCTNLLYHTPPTLHTALPVDDIFDAVAPVTTIPLNSTTNQAIRRYRPYVWKTVRLTSAS